MDKRTLKRYIFKCIFLTSLIVLVLGIIVISIAAYSNYTNALETTGEDFIPYMASFSGDLLTAFRIILVIVIAASLALSVFLAKHIAKTINSFSLDYPDEKQIYSDFAPFVSKLKDKNAKTAEQIHNLKIEYETHDNLRRDFTANVSHELKTPLTSISGYAELIKSGIAKQEDIPRFAEKIYDESHRLTTLVGDIIKLSQLDDGEFPVKIEHIDLYDMCQSIIEQLDFAAKSRNITFSLVGTHLGIDGPEQIIEEMIFNICDNAIKYNKNGGSVNISLAKYADGIELSVSDTGIGIPEEDLPNIFQRFYRVDKSHSKEIGGTGLGLSIVKHAAMFLGAQVFVESVVDKGTTIKILF